MWKKIKLQEEVLSSSVLALSEHLQSEVDSIDEVIQCDLAVISLEEL